MNPKRHKAREKRGIGRKSGQGAFLGLPAVYGARPGKEPGAEGRKKNLATPYSPTDEPQYHRRRGVSLSCSGWERVGATSLWSPGRPSGNGGSASTSIGPVPGPPRPLVLFRERERQYGQASRLISTGRLNTLPCLHLQPIEQVVSLFPSGPSWGRGCLILRRASRLDAFSGYPFRTWLPGSCPWQDNRHTRGPSTSVLSY